MVKSFSNLQTGGSRGWGDNATSGFIIILTRKIFGGGEKKNASSLLLCIAGFSLELHTGRVVNDPVGRRQTQAYVWATFAHIALMTPAQKKQKTKKLFPPLVNVIKNGIRLHFGVGTNVTWNQGKNKLKKRINHSAKSAHVLGHERLLMKVLKIAGTERSST